MIRLRAGDRAAFDVIVDELWPLLRAFAGRLGASGADAEDIAQEVFVKICGRISDFDPRRDGLAWALGIAAYEWKTRKKRAHRQREVSDERVQGLAAEGRSQEEALLDRQLEAALRATVGEFSEAERAALGVGPSQLGPLDAAHRKRRQRALGKLRELWRRIYGDA